MAVEPRSHQAIVPSTFSAKASELMLAYHMGGEAIRVGVCLLFRRRQDVDFPVSLFERLQNAVVLKPASPAKNRLRIRSQWVPKFNCSAQSQINDTLVIPIDDFSVEPRSQLRFSVPFKPPNQAPRKSAKQWVVQKVLMPVLVTHLSLINKE